jgi:hypothetical protein
MGLCHQCELDRESSPCAIDAFLDIHLDNSVGTIPSQQVIGAVYQVKKAIDAHAIRDIAVIGWERFPLARDFQLARSMPRPE